MNTKDIKISLIIGLLTGLMWSWVLIRLNTFESLGLPTQYTWSLVILVPILYLGILFIAGKLTRAIGFIESFVKYGMVGLLNTGVDFGIFNLLMVLTGNTLPGLALSSFKGMSFVVAVINSYFWNKYWSFRAASSTEEKGKEFFKFLLVNIVGALLNVGITSAITLTIAPQFGFGQIAWNNIAAVVATAIALIWNFIGFRFIVFKKKPSNV